MESEVLREDGDLSDDADLDAVGFSTSNHTAARIPTGTAWGRLRSRLGLFEEMIPVGKSIRANCRNFFGNSISGLVVLGGKLFFTAWEGGHGTGNMDPRWSSRWLRDARQAEEREMSLLSLDAYFQRLDTNNAP